MSVRRLFPLLVLIYVALDIANPLMPGVVQLVDGTIEVVQADRVRATVDEAPLLVAALLGCAVVVRDRPVRRMPVRRRPVSRWRHLLSAALPSRFRPLDPASSEDD